MVCLDFWSFHWSFILYKHMCACTLWWRLWIFMPLLLYLPFLLQNKCINNLRRPLYLPCWLRITYPSEFILATVSSGRLPLVSSELSVPFLCDLKFCVCFYQSNVTCTQLYYHCLLGPVLPALHCTFTHLESRDQGQLMSELPWPGTALGKLCIKGRVVNIVGFARETSSVVTTWVWHHSMKAAMNNT